MPFINKPDLDRLLELVENQWGNDDLQSEASNILDKAKENMADPALREAAHDEYALGSDNNIEIDDEPAIAPASGGTWVAAWVWMPDDEDEDEEEDEPEEPPLDTPSLDTSFHDHEMAVD